METIPAKLESCSPFSTDPSLRNIVIGIVAGEDVDVHKYEKVGKGVMDRMLGQPVFPHSFKRKEKATTLGDGHALKIAPDRSIDPNLLFQRYIVVSRMGGVDLEEVMSYELSPFPPALFEGKHVLRRPDKASLAHAVTDHANQTQTSIVIDEIPNTDMYVLDGGSLLHRLPWNRGDSYKKIVRSYADR